MNTHVVGKKFVGDFDWILGNLFFGQRVDLIARAHSLGYEALGVTRLNHAAR